MKLALPVVVALLFSPQTVPGGLEGTAWRAVELAGMPVSGSDSCNGSTGKPHAVFERGQTPASAAPLDGTSWQLVKFQGSDGRTLAPDDRSKFTLEFTAGGRVAARVDCNRGSASWKVNGSQLALGPLALTRMQCPDSALHDHFVKQWSFVRSFVIKDGHLFLALVADGGTYEFEPLKKP